MLGIAERFLLYYDFPFPQVRLTVEVPPAVCDDCYSRVIKELTKRAKVFVSCNSTFNLILMIWLHLCF